MTKKSQTKYWNMSAKNNVGTIYIYGDIVGDKWFDEETSANSFKDELNELGDVSTIDLHINSGGGSVFEGFAIYNMLKQHKAKVDVQVDGIAASIASVIAMA
ncbi:MAG: Clp protease ClpP, partial [Leuconostoc mesenteroides]